LGTTVGPDLSRALDTLSAYMHHGMFGYDRRPRFIAGTADLSASLAFLLAGVFCSSA